MAFVQRLLPVFSSVVILGFFPPFEWIVLSSRIRPSYVVESVFFMIVTPGFPLDQSGCNSKNVFIFFSHKLWIFKHKMYFYHLRKRTHSELNRWFRVLLISLKVFGEVFFEEVAVWKLNGISNIWTKTKEEAPVGKQRLCWLEVHIENIQLRWAMKCVGLDKDCSSWS